METCFNYINSYAFFSSDERKWINRIYKLQETNPEEVTILAEPQNNDGCIYCQLPANWLKIQPPRHVEMSEERKQGLAERLRSLRKTN